MASFIYAAFGLFTWFLFGISKEKTQLLTNQHVAFVDWLQLISGSELLSAIVFVLGALFLFPLIMLVFDRLTGIERSNSK